MPVRVAVVAEEEEEEEGEGMEAARRDTVCVDDSGDVVLLCLLALSACSNEESEAWKSELGGVVGSEEAPTASRYGNRSRRGVTPVGSMWEEDEEEGATAL
jgi:hypothetical protein